MNELALIKKQLSTHEGIELSNSSDITVTDKKLFVYKDLHVLVYIRDQYVKKNSPFEYKFHICSCKTIEDMMKVKRFARYVVSTRNDGMFVVNSYDLETKEKIESERITKLNVCKNCLMELKYNGYSNHHKDKHIYNSFRIDEFFSQYAGEFNQKPRFNDKDAPPNEYSKNFEQVSYSVRAINGWQCSNCKINLQEDKDLLDAHHINGIRSDDVWDNLQCLCVCCHSQQPFHERLKNDERYLRFMTKYRKKK